MPKAKKLVEKFAKVADQMVESSSVEGWIEVYATVDSKTWQIYEGQARPQRLNRLKRYPWSPNTRSFVCIRFHGDIKKTDENVDLPKGWIPLADTPTGKASEVVFVPFERGQTKTPGKSKDLPASA